MNQAPISVTVNLKFFVFSVFMLKQLTTLNRDFEWRPPLLAMCGSAVFLTYLGNRWPPSSPVSIFRTDWMPASTGKGRKRSAARISDGEFESGLAAYVACSSPWIANIYETADPCWIQLGESGSKIKLTPVLVVENIPVPKHRPTDLNQEVPPEPSIFNNLSMKHKLCIEIPLSYVSLTYMLLAW